MRCPDCNKFVPFDEGNVDEVEVEIDEDTGTVSITGRVVLPCAECGTELKELAVDDQVETADDFRDPIAEIKRAVPVSFEDKVTPEWFEKECSVKYEFDGEPDTEFSERTQTTMKVPVKKKGQVVGYKEKRIKSSRYMKTFKGVTVTGTVKRTVTFADPVWPGAKLEEDVEFEHTVEEAASAFDDLV